jgi:UPF0755 protein
MVPTSVPEPSASRRRSWLCVLQVGLPALLLFVAVPPVSWWYLGRPTPAGGRQEVRIQAGMSARRIGELLEERGLVRNARVFEWTARLEGLARQLEAGAYRLDGARGTTGIVLDLRQAPLPVEKITIPEGLTRWQTAGALAAAGLVDSARFVSVCESSELARRVGLEAPTLEGYLFPDTYYFDSHPGEEAVAERMVGQFRQVVSDSLRRRLDEVGLTLHQAVILASIVEREAQAPEERPIIAAIFERRLQLEHRLESCATVEFALGMHKERLSESDVQVPSPYNTYLHAGLPPGPIANPGRAALLATLYPWDLGYLFFVARGDGTHLFSRTHAEHEAAKEAIRRTLERRARWPRAN